MCPTWVAHVPGNSASRSSRSDSWLPVAEGGHRGAGLLVRLPGCVPFPARTGTLVPGLIENTLGLVESVAGGVERGLRPLHRGQDIGERLLGRGQPAAQFGRLSVASVSATGVQRTTSFG